MDRIAILDASLADKIAAGEVVERPFSVVKELTENAIDAGSSKIDIKVIDGGRSFIEVKDNGCGMSLNDAKLSLKRHATSKIKHNSDLFKIKTMGFRGEALAAISSVSKFSMITKEKDASNGVKLFCLNSNVESVEPIACNYGTTIQVEELFYNTPARLKYLKNESTELASITDIVYKLALANPDISFSLTSNDKLVFKSSGKNDVIEIIGSIYGINVAKNMMPFKVKTPDFVIEGYTSKIEVSKSNRYAISTFMNKRYIKNKMLSDTIIDGYHEFLFENRYPYTVLYITMDSSLLDVNVHPTKQEIRISKEIDLKNLIKETINNTLKTTSQIINQKVYKEVNSTQQFFDFAEPNTEKYENIKLDVKETIKKDFEIIGQIHGTYIIAQNEDGFILVDQHAAAERVRYEKYKELFKEPKFETPLLVPLVLDLPIDEFELVKSNLELLKEVCIEAEVFGSNSIKISSIPYFLKHVDINIYVEECISQIVTNKKIDKNTLIDYAIATAACKASLKANSYLSTLEMETIITDLFKCNDPYTCPHGRPTMIKYSSYELEKFFKRKN